MSERYDLFDIVCALVVAFVIGLICGLFSNADKQVAKMQRAAVENGAAEWVVQPETGETTFRWKDHN